MNATTMHTTTATGNRRGVALLAALLILALVTVMGVYSASKTTIEINVAGKAKLNVSAFYVAEGALNHASELLRAKFATLNAQRLAGGQTPVWTSVLNGTEYGTIATSNHCQGCESGDSVIDGTWSNGGVEVIQERVITVDGNEYYYTVTVWDNDESYKDSTYDGWDTTCADGDDADADGVSDPVNDCDGQVIIRAVATAVKDGDVLAESIQELAITGGASNVVPVGTGPDQQAGGVGKSGVARDTNEIDAGDLGTSVSL